MKLLQSKTIGGIKLETFLLGDSNAGDYKHRILKKKTFSNGRIEKVWFQGNVTINKTGFDLEIFRPYKRQSN